jgi:hypothetical protein
MAEGQTKCEKAYESIFSSGSSVLKTIKDANGNIETIREYAPGYRELFESLKDILGNDIAESIKNFSNYNKPVLFIGSISLIRCAVAYLWYTHDPATPPLVIACSGLNEGEVLEKVNGEYIETAFTNIECCTSLGGILFFEDLNPYENILKQLWKKVEGNKGPGILVIGMGNIDNLSQGVLYRFEVIPLETEKQITQKTKGAKKLFYSYNEQDELILFFKKDESITLTENETKLFIFLVKDRRTPEEIIEHVWEVYKPKEIAKKKEKGNVKELRNRINNKCCKIGVENLISKLTAGCYSLTVEVVEG